METLLTNKRNLVIVVIVIVGVLAYVLFNDVSNKKSGISVTVRKVNESPTPRDTGNISQGEGRKVFSSGQAIPFVGSDRFVIEGGSTVKESYEITNKDALVWSPDAKLVYIRSLGTVTLDGKSSGWEVAYGSKTKKKGLIFTVVRGGTSSQKEVSSTAYGYDLPKNWYDGEEAFKAVQGSSAIKDATITGLSFYYNDDGKRWGYAIVSSVGTISVPVR